VDFEWDEKKRASNFLKHGVDFEDAMHIFLGTVIQKPDARDYKGEDRFIAFGELDGRLLVVIYTLRGSVCRIISARKANGRERRAYYEALSSVTPTPDD
jgi:Uncharacterized protein conserved in bacteria